MPEQKQDIAPGLLLEVRNKYHENIRNNKRLQKQLEKVEAGDGDYLLADLIAEEYANCLSDAFDLITEDGLPDGRMYFNIADRVVRPLLEENRNNILAPLYDIQGSMNKKSGMDIKVVELDE